MTKRTMTTGLLALVLSLSTMATALAYDFPSTNDINRTNNFPHVNLVESGAGFVTLQFVNDTNSLAFFEYRIDGEVLTSGTSHPVVTGDFIYEGVSLDSRNVEDPVHAFRTFEANSTVEVRLALGGERDWDFDWVTFEALPDASTKDDCRTGGWEAYGFANQGQCIRFVETGQDSR
jgi:hypothetical protein